MAKPAIGFGREARDGEDDEAIKRMFTPEFRNRLDAMIAVLEPAAGDRRNAWSTSSSMQLEAQLADRNVTIELTDGGARLAREEGLRHASTARARSPASSRSTSRSRSPTNCCSAQLKKGGIVKVGYDDDKLTFAYKPDPNPSAAKARKRKRAASGDGDKEPVLAGIATARRPGRNCGSQSCVSLFGQVMSAVLRAACRRRRRRCTRRRPR